MVLWSSITPVKGFVVLAIVLLIPTMAYFQKQHFVNRMQPKLQAAVMEILEAAEVETPAVRMDLLDAVISGRVATDERRVEIGAQVDALAGVRVRPEGNQLLIYGWIEISRVDGSFGVEGVMPPGFALHLPGHLEREEGWKNRLERRESVESPRGAADWGGFLETYFQLPGNRRVTLRERELKLGGDATVGLRSDWLAKASAVVAKDEVVDEFKLHPSIYHFPGYGPESLSGEVAVDELRSQLKGNIVDFGNATELKIPAAEVDKVTLIAFAMLQADPAARYVVGGHPDRTGNATVNDQRALKRAEEVGRVLVEKGMAPEKLELMSFGVTPDGTRDNQVEVVVK